VKERFQGEPAEAVVLRERIGPLPSHVFVIRADSEISTYSLFGIMDYCLTVRGTVGIEASCFGIPVLTAGTGRYDRKGFTIDSDSPGDYLEKIARITKIPRLSSVQRELAERYAYGLFVLRPLRLESVTLEYFKDFEGLYKTQIFKTRINIKEAGGWRDAADLRAFTRWVSDTSQTDFLTTFPGNWNPSA
jgi:hypothetical protein